MAKNINPKKTWKYPEKFKLKAVKLSLQKGTMVKDVAAMLDIHPVLLSRWRQEFREGKIRDDGRLKLVDIEQEKAELDRIVMLEKQVASLKQENELLKKWQRFLAEQHQKGINSSRGTENTE